MLIVMQQGATESQIEAVVGRLIELGFNVHRSTGVIHTLLGGVGGRDDFDLESFQVMEGVKEAHRIISPYKLASRTFRPQGTLVEVGGAGLPACAGSRGVSIGAGRAVVIAGPGAVESEEQIERAAEIVARAGAQVLSAAAPTEEALAMLRAAADRHDLLVATEATEISRIPLASQYADLLQVAARNMQNTALLRELGTQPKPVLIHRGLAATVEDLLMSAEIVLTGGNYNVILCESGIRTFETATRHTMDLSSIPVVKKLSHLPIVAAPSHATGRRDYVAPMARAAMAAGADGLLLEVHPDPDRAQGDGAQSLRPADFERLVQELRPR